MDERDSRERRHLADKREPRQVIVWNGRGGGIRTPDPLLPKQMRYQTALRPDIMLIVSSAMWLQIELGPTLYPITGPRYAR